jgi:2-keto-4-pentenoate hydratase
MMATPTEIRELAHKLIAAEQSRTPIGPLTAIASLSVADAYEVQRLTAQARIEGSDPVKGHKIGLTAKVMQEYFKVSEPDYGHLFASMFVPNGSALDLSRLIDPQIEVEPAFILKSPLRGPGITRDDVLAATEWIVPSFEIIDSRITDWAIKLQDTIADNGSSALVVLGDARIRPQDLALDAMDTRLLLDGAVVETGNTAAILGHPAEGIAWLANAVGAHGVSLEAGHVLLPGTATRSHRIAGHRTARAEVDGLGTVELSFVNKPAVVRS